MDEDAETLRRRIDGQFSEAIKDFQVRQLDVSARLARIDEMLSHLKIEFDAGRQSRMTIQEQQTTITERLSALAVRFNDHINDESAERELLQAMTRTVAGHSERLSMIERMQVALWSVVGTVSAGGVAWVIGPLTLGAVRQ